MKQMKLGVVGCGNISDAYLRGGANSKIVAVKSVTDINPDSAKTKAETHGVSAVTYDEMLADPDVQIIINLTVPQAHAEISKLALQAGKHVYSEKPFAVTFSEAQELVRVADDRKLRIGSAPDTFLGAGHQTVRKLIDEGRIGTVTGGAVTFATPGMEMWHPNPFFFFQKGGGPVLDIGCYPITQLVNCLGPVRSVVAHASKGQEKRTITSDLHKGEQVTVEVPTTVNGILDFANGANVSFTASWDIWKHQRKPIELYGTEGSILNPDPNFFGGAVKISARNGDWEAIDISTQPFGKPNQPAGEGREVANYRMAGVYDMAAAINSGRSHRANGGLALHVLEIMESLERASSENRRIYTETSCERPATVPQGEGEEVFLAE
ncbi:MAG: Gfo/Idh/MocA family oxidoreductase [Hyphomicrobiales bacterium]|nr:Gfo/Idh/MocA family oxidoreductase [Hyphomicrobiales bacterium]